MNIQEQLKKIIEDQLPSAQAEGLREYIEQSEEAKIELKDYMASFSSLEKSYEDLDKKYNDICRYKREYKEAYNDMIKRDAALGEREKAITEREDRIEVNIANTRMGMMQKNMNNMTELVNKVFGHPSVSVSTMNKSHPVDGGMNGPGYVTSSGVIETDVTVEGKV